MSTKADNLIPPNERVIAEYHPSPLTIPLWHHWALAACLLLALVAWVVERFLLSSGAAPTSTWIRIVLAVMVWLVLSALDVGVRRYVVTEKRLIVRMGVFARMVVDMPLSRVQHSVWTQTVTQRVVGIGDVIVSSAGVDAPPIVFAGVDNPARVLEVIREAREHSANDRHEPGTVTPVIGLVGGIGAGKSTVAQVFAHLGCLVIDADRDAREALFREDVVKELVSWWGDGILGPDGKPDRARIAEIVFKDPSQRTRLEGLVHPIVKSDRLLTIARARQEGRPAVIIDAPLLFEAGSDKDCDAVVFVDAPPEQRLARVRARGWSSEELARREAAQLPLSDKRARSAVVIENTGSLESLQTLARAALTKIRQDASAGRIGRNPSA
ncbi:MAG TPA: dephospho-CoA kinase [Phycisphaerales bacterium]|nr:dephospho-CoA kinase [Phycisphaerales bacterium]